MASLLCGSHIFPGYRTPQCDTMTEQTKIAKGDSQQMLDLYEELFGDRYSEKDEEFMAVVETPSPPPPCVANWYSRPKRDNSEIPAVDIRDEILGTREEVAATLITDHVKTTGTIRMTDLAIQRGNSVRGL
ncbi:hypothetical protein CAPTEDRAFT_222248 [Capitella teleta]|uniref:Uncharacterized protein n=1 Tax=Capitella teleta TaxID=283909 RepID=R7UL85_CAPTE|nr:hypothetical protein CAPTEDRAFT_222248 [Capitella teleta]|eukprot:ELU07304.1 hypothetical protein CAPTEDRAFT_222248 [Capitella teleta]